MKHLAKIIIVLMADSACLALPVETEAPLGGGNSLTAILEGDDLTKTHLSGPEGGIYYPYWSEEDLLAVFVEGSSLAEKYVLASGKDSRKATFKGAGTGNNYVAFYPYQSAGNLKNGTVSFSLPEVQEYSSGSFGEGAFPMLAVSSTNSLSFKNLCAVLKVSLTGSASVQAITLIANDPDIPLSGKATVSTSAADAPEMVMDNGGSPQVRLETPGVQLSEQQATDFFIVIPPGTYKGGISLKIKTSEGIIKRSTDKDLVFRRSEVRGIPAFECKDGVIDPEDLPDNMIWYVTSTGEKLNLRQYMFIHPILSNTYQDGHGEIVLAGSLNEIPYNAFYGLPVTEVYVPSCIERIGQNAFAMTPLKSFKVPEKLSKVDYCAFGWCPNLSKFTGAHTFDDGKAIVLDDEIVAYIGDVGARIEIPSGVRSIAQNSFVLADEVAPRVREVILPEGIINVCGGNFTHLPSLEYITLPSTFCVAWQGIFSYCPSLKEFRGPCSYIHDNGNLLMSNDGHVTDFAGAGITDYVLPEGVKYIETEVFSGKPALKSVTFPDSIRGIFEYAFREVENLCSFYGKGASADTHSLVIDGAVVAITPGIEEYTSPPEASEINLWIDFPIKKITLNDNVRSICNFAFYDASELQTLVLPASLLTLGNYCFGEMNELKEIYFRGTDPPTCGIAGRCSFASGFTVYVPEESLEAYKNATSLSFLRPYMKGYKPSEVSSSNSLDGKVIELQKASMGNGIDIVVMGDAFSEKQFENGTYDRIMKQVSDAFFEVEPYKSYRHLFNVYQVDVVSYSDGYSGSGQALKTWFGDGTSVGGNDDLCAAYAKRAVQGDRLKNALILIAMNSDNYAGTCYMTYYSSQTGDWGDGIAFAYFPLCDSPETRAQVIQHEAGGHGFAKLSDEYAYESNGAIPYSDIFDVQSVEGIGWCKNVDFTSDPSSVKWKHFLADERYKYDDLGVYEGAMTYWTGVYRPSFNSIMRLNTGGFNAPSREAIWYRIHKLAFGKDWTYRYEDFVSYDAINRKSMASSSTRASSNAIQRQPLAPPVIRGVAD